MSLPRIGDEVIVAFENGDPDRPLIVGRVYNKAAKPPHDPMAMRTVTTFKTNTSKGGGGFNEFRFDDKAGEENVFLHAQKDHDIRVLNDEREWLGNDRHSEIGNSAFHKIATDRHDTIGASTFTEIGDTLNLGVGADILTEAGANSHLTVGTSAFLTAGSTVEIDAGSDVLVASGADIVADAGGAVHLKAGSKIVLEASSGITLKVGGNFITIDASGVAIKGTMVQINTGGSALPGPGTAPGAATAPEPPTAPDEALNGEPGTVAKPPPSRPREIPALVLDAHPVAAALRAAAQSGAPFCEQCAAAAAEAAEAGA
jgi:type VI secretion system secreted protein VgrG